MFPSVEGWQRWEVVIIFNHQVLLKYSFVFEVINGVDIVIFQELMQNRLQKFTEILFGLFCWIEFETLYVLFPHCEPKAQHIPCNEL